jgi:hypothetical protein
MACTVIGGFDLDGQPWLASNSDNPYSSRTRVIVDTVDGVRFVGTRIVSLEGSVEWDDMISRAVNEHGVGFTWTSIPNGLPSVAAGSLNLKTIGRRLATARDVSEAVSALQQGNKSVSGCFLLADAGNSEIAIVEVAGGEASVLHIYGEGMVARANCFETPELRHLEAAVEYNPYRVSASKRVDRVKELADGAVDARWLARVLRDHDGRERGGEYGWSICNHGTAYGSVSSEILAPGSGSMYYAFGWPCGEEAPAKIINDPWGSYFGFTLRLSEGEYSRPDGALCARGIKALANGEIEVLERRRSGF